MLIKSILCVTLLIFTSGIGYGFALKYRKRKQFFTQLYEFNEKFLHELSFSRRPLAEFIKNTCFKGEFLDLLRAFVALEESEVCFLNFFSNITFLKTEEEQEITQFFADLGKGDSESQKKSFSNRLKLLSQKKIEVENEYKKYSNFFQFSIAKCKLLCYNMRGFLLFNRKGE